MIKLMLGMVFTVALATTLTGCGEDNVAGTDPNRNEPTVIRGRCEADTDCPTGTTCRTEAGVCMDPPQIVEKLVEIERIVEKEVPVEVPEKCDTDQDCEGAVCKSNGLCYEVLHTTEIVEIEKEVLILVPLACTVDADCVEPDAVCKSNGICYKMVHEVVYGGCTENSQCQGGRSCNNGFCEFPAPTPVCGSILENGRTVRTVVDGYPKVRQVRFYGDRLSAYSGFAPFTFGLSAAGDPGCQAVNVNMMAFDIRYTDIMGVQPEFELQVAGIKNGTFTKQSDVYMNAGWTHTQYYWSTNVPLLPNQEKEVSIVCTNCSNLPMNWSLYIQVAPQVEYSIGWGNWFSLQLSHQLANLTVFGYEVTAPGVCGTTINENWTHIPVTSQLEMYSGTFTDQFTTYTPGYDTGLYSVKLKAKGGASCNGMRLDRLVFDIGGSAINQMSNFRVVNAAGQPLAATNAPTDGKLNFWSGGFILNLTPGQEIELFIVADTTNVTSGKDSWVDMNSPFGWTDRSTGEHFTSREDWSLPQFQTSN